MTKYFRKNLGSWIQAYLFFLSRFFFVSIHVVLFVLIYFLRNKEDAFMGIIVDVFRTILTNGLKLTYADSRPGLVDEEIALYPSCICDFGKPSGHTITFGVLLFYFLNIFILK